MTGLMIRKYASEDLDYDERNTNSALVGLIWWKFHERKCHKATKLDFNNINSVIESIGAVHPT